MLIIVLYRKTESTDLSECFLLVDRTLFCFLKNSSTTRFKLKEKWDKCSIYSLVKVGKLKRCDISARPPMIISTWWLDSHLRIYCCLSATVRPCLGWTTTSSENSVFIDNHAQNARASMAHSANWLTKYAYLHRYI